MTNIYVKSEERRKNDERMIMTIEEEEIKRKKKKRNKNKNKKSNRVGHVQNLDKIVAKQIRWRLVAVFSEVCNWNMIFLNSLILHSRRLSMVFL